MFGCQLSDAQTSRPVGKRNFYLGLLPPAFGDPVEMIPLENHEDLRRQKTLVPGYRAALFA